MEKNSILAIWVIASLVLGAILGSVIMPEKVKTVPVASQCAPIPELSCPAPVVNTIDTENGWKAQAVDLANKEWSEKGYKKVFLELNNIDVKEDITKVVIVSSKVTDSDAFNKDAEITQEIKVYYEDESGKDVKAYLIIDTSISNGEVKDQEINLK